MIDRVEMFSSVSLINNCSTIINYKIYPLDRPEVLSARERTISTWPRKGHEPCIRSK
uniref:Uncharacterized protein n=1 Tax=Arundo donax TaxID=35708 RepID=A0A0A9DLJ8_ARUDO